MDEPVLRLSTVAIRGARWIRATSLPEVAKMSVAVRGSHLGGWIEQTVSDKRPLGIAGTAGMTDCAGGEDVFRRDVKYRIGSGVAPLKESGRLARADQLVRGSHVGDSP